MFGNLFGYRKFQLSQHIHTIIIKTSTVSNSISDDFYLVAPVVFPVYMRTESYTGSI